MLHLVSTQFFFCSRESKIGTKCKTQRCVLASTQNAHGKSFPVREAEEFFEEMRTMMGKVGRGKKKKKRDREGKKEKSRKSQTLWAVCSIFILNRPSSISLSNFSALLPASSLSFQRP
ncbi:hypothetical protein L6164_016201 [Bauhinia variegata]|uniref:Uncharacterized protein n=1 Tax=Bauhinia variegata TaxID=167791 RepID=A0ACB9NS18_BAUVA|nr:hypothetical protein L6164_016201 [Bauhinia variegata]